MWGDGSGYQLLLDADHNTFGTTIPATGALTQGGDVPASVYAEFEYKVPENADGALSTQNIVLDGAVTITIPAGTYDYCITNPTPGTNGRMWIASGTDARGDDIEFVDGSIYHFTVARNGQNDLVTLEITVIPTEPTILCNPAQIDFGSVMLGNSQTMTSSVAGYLLSSAITATTAAPFEVSADGTTFSSSVSLNADGGTLYVKYTPTEEGTDNGTVTVASGELTETITLSGSAFSCDGYTIPYSYDFEDATSAQCWTIEDANSDGYAFAISGGYASIRYNTQAPHDDWLISPELTLTGNEYVSFDYKGSASFPEKFQVYAIQGTTRTLVQDTTLANTGAYQNAIIDLSAYTGATKVGIHCVSDADEFYFYVDNFRIDVSEPTLTVAPDSIDFAVIEVGTTREAEATVTALAITEAITLTASAPFAVSVDGTNYATTATLPAPTGLAATYTVYVQYAPTAAGTQTGEITLSSSGDSAIVAVEGNAVVCEAVTEFPYNCGFEPNSEQVICWETVDVDNNGVDNGGQISFMAYDEANPGCAVYSYDDSLAANDWLISPEFVLSGNMYAAFDYLVANSTYPETFSVYVIPEGETYATATQVLAPMAVTNTAWETQRIALGAYNGQTVRIAIHVESAANQYYIAFDNFTVDAAEVDLVATPNTLTFNAIAGSATQAQTVQVSSWSLTENIAVTTNAPFEVSADGNAFATTATLNYAADDYTDVTLYVRYNPAEVGSDNGVVTLISTGDTATITVNGTAIDCSQAEALPFTEDFEDELSACWQNIDADGDGRTWFNALDLGLDAFNGDGAYVSASYDNNYGVLTPENWLISPAIAIPEEGAVISWYVAAQDANYPEEYYQVMVSTGNSVSDFSTILFSEELSSGDWEERTVNIEGFNGQNVYIAFVHMNSSDKYMMKIDDINITAGTVGIEENEANNTVRVFPNPATNMINVEAQGFAQYQLVNMLGQTVESNNLVNGNAQINVANLSNGVYFVRLINGNTVETVKVIKK